VWLRALDAADRSWAGGRFVARRAGRHLRGGGLQPKREALGEPAHRTLIRLRLTSANFQPDKLCFQNVCKRIVWSQSLSRLDFYLKGVRKKCFFARLFPCLNFVHPALFHYICAIINPKHVKHTLE